MRGVANRHKQEKKAQADPNEQHQWRRRRGQAFLAHPRERWNTDNCQKRSQKKRRNNVADGAQTRQDNDYRSGAEQPQPRIALLHEEPSRIKKPRRDERAKVYQNSTWPQTQKS